jgi:hydroxypyruvate reductase
MTVRTLRAILRASLRAGLASVDAAARVERAFPRVPARTRALTLLAVGKAAVPMMRGALAASGGSWSQALVVSPLGAPSGADLDPRVERIEAPHPDPDRRSVAAARRALEVAHAGDFVVALISGGASSLICLPETVPLSLYVRVVRALLLGGATVRDVNVVRRHLCSVKGGGLARAAGGPVHSLVVSDVIGGHLHDVGSGPTVADPTTRAQARAVLRRVVPRAAPPPMRESLKPGDPVARRLHARILSRPEDLAAAVADALRARLDRVSVLPPSVGEVDALARDYVERARSLRAGQAFVRSAEPSVHVDVASPGRGGRCSHLALAVARALPPDVVFLAGASDGVDGASGTAGAVVDASLRRRASPDALARAAARFDSASVLEAAGMSMPQRPTGHNLADVHVLARVDAEE